MYILIVYFDDDIKYIHCDTYEEAEAELVKILSKTNILRYEIKCR